MCHKNRENREVQQMLHRTGRKSFASIEHEETKKRGVRPSRIEMFKLGYVKKDGTYSNAFTQQKAEEMGNLINEREEGLNSLDDEHIFTQVLGPDRPGRVRCRGHGVVPSSEGFNSRSGSSQSIQEAKRAAEIAQREAEAARNELEDYKKISDERARKMEEDVARLTQALLRFTERGNGDNP
ncbi:uncharacterized protein LOC119996478 [Tripterygium wilfordii]|uniref:uncharacterized protein LOC119996478 n=1 Tax=Tripterygium wilfordii TaxID=458696 RepID=UPI0018F85BA3|nr:uncharacterized protein LOC119996478 [Tripterygium wilfordii]XP_038699048.1 uncharacterized protein LOC119996478 [Tripterygium wilfordii]XP_038699049.1 uncharacterized protein LOC119996478 [Tripterygium wilfordii]XP_038699050.1 uncharacterized protein LOC119996478 [Tripterygium wilfordii]XP_038699051.1 uncharacterized protein LOC119996478 [Tripterygium wilfordii]